MKCPSCGHANPDGAPECAVCGYVFRTPASAVAPSPGPPVVRVTCPGCRTTAAATGLFCARCGQLLPVQDGAVYAGEYRVEKMIGQGGMGRVYRALSLADQRPVAIKELVDDRGWSAEERAPYLKAFQREAELLAHLRVLRTVPQLVAPFREWNGRYFFVMEFVEGKNLLEALRERGQPFEVDTVIHWAVELCELLRVLHNEQPDPIVHQDLKPENIILRRPGQGYGDIVLLDFGVARFVRVGTKLSVYGGTSGYAPREQFVERRPQPRSDLYSLAACMHHLLTGRDPTENPPPFPPARKLNPQVPEWLSQLIAINLSDDPRERYDSAAKMREDLLGRRVTATLTCPSCGTENERSLIYCRRCARALVRAASTCRNCAQFIPVNARFCPHCGSKV